MFSKKLWFSIIRGLAALAVVTLLLVPATVANASTPTSPTLLGSSVSSSSDLAAKTTQFGQLPVVRVYFPGLPPADAWSTGLAGANASAVVVSFKVLPQYIISDSNDPAHKAAISAIANFFDTAPTGRPIYYVYWHEPEDNIAAKDFTLADYLTAWGDVVKLADDAHKTNLHSTLVLMGFDVLPDSGRNWKSYLPPGNIISTISWDAYPVNGEGIPSPESFMGADVAAAKAAGMPFGFSEFNTATVTGRPAWLTSVGTYIASSGAIYGTLYDASQNGGLAGSGTFVISDLPSENAWKGSVADGAVDTQPPTVPQAVTGSPVNDNEVNLSWTASTDDVAVAGYYIYRNGVWVGSSPTASYTDQGLTRATSYQYSVYAYDEVGNMSAESGFVSVTTMDVAPPTSPSDLTVFVAISQLRLNWTASTDDAGTLAGYDIYCDGRRVGATAATNYLATQLNQGTTYRYTIEAYDSAGNTSPQSMELTATTLTLSRGPREAFSSPPTLGLNENSFGVAIVQYGLKWLGFYSATGIVNGHYGPVTDAAIRAFQKRYNCQPPHSQAHFGPGSWDALTSARGSATSLPTLVWNESSFGVVIVQYSLQRLGFYPRSSGVTGRYNSVTDSAIRAFQSRYNSVPAYGASRFGNGSWYALTNATVG